MALQLSEQDKAYMPTLTLIRHTGLLLAWQQQTLHYRGTPAQLKTKLWEITGKNLLFGWWSIFSLFINPSVTIGNFFLYWSYLSQWNRFTASPHTYTEKIKQGGLSKRDQWIAGVFKIICPIVLLIVFASVLQ